MTRIDIATNTAGGEVQVPAFSAPVAIGITPDGKTAYVVNRDPHNVSPIDLATGVAGHPIAVGDYPGAIAITPDGTRAFVASGRAGEVGLVTPIDLSTNTAGTPIKVADQPYAIAMTPDGAMAYVAGEGDAVSGRTLTPVDLSTNHAADLMQVKSTGAIVITKDGRTAYVTDLLDNTVTPVELATGKPGAPIKVGGGPAGLALIP